MDTAFFPLFVDLTKKKVLIVGGGSIAARRTQVLLDFAEDITVVAPEITEELRELVRENRLTWLSRKFQVDDLEECELVLALTDDHPLNEEIALECKRRKIPVNVCHRKELCDFYFPGIVNRENLVVGVSASGENHRKAKRLREKMEECVEAFFEGGNT